HYGRNVGPFLIHELVHEIFAGLFTFSRHFLAGCIDDDDVLLAQPALVHRRRRNGDSVLRQPAADVSVTRRDVAALVSMRAKLGTVLLCLTLVQIARDYMIRSTNRASAGRMSSLSAGASARGAVGPARHHRQRRWDAARHDHLWPHAGARSPT